MKKTISFADLTHTGQLIASNTFPYGASLIAEYIQQEIPDYFESFVCKYPEDLSQYLDHVIPDLACFSNYSWNFSLAYEFCTRIKEHSPDTITIFGGPNFPISNEEQAEFLLDHPNIDFYIQFEGEQAMVSLLQELKACDWDCKRFKRTRTKLSNTHYRIDDTVIHGELGPRIAKLGDIPSPYLSGRCDKFFDGVLIPMLQTNRGCPFLCTFCTEGQSFYNKVNKYSRERIFRDLDYIAERVTVPDLYIVDSNFGMFKEDLEVCRYISDLQKTYGWPKYLHVSTGKNNKELVLEAASILDGAMSFSATIQTSDQQILKNIKRSNISLDQLIEAAKTAQGVGANSYSEVIMCLPGDTREKHVDSILALVDSDVNFVRMYQLMMLPGSEMSQKQTRNEYGMKTSYRVMPRNFGIYRFLEDTFSCGEVEEICISNATFSYQDYVACREFQLTIEMFYNGGIFRELMQLLNRKGLTTSSFIQAVHAHAVSHETLQGLYRGYVQETEGSLWSDKEEVKTLLTNPEQARRYVSEEAGNNELFKYRALGYFFHIDALHEVAFHIAAQLLKQHAQDDELTGQYLVELKSYSLLKKQGILDHGQSINEYFHFNFSELEEQDFKLDVDQVYCSEGLSFEFFQDEEQQTAIEGYLKQYGKSVTGLGRILLRSHIKTLYRRMKPARVAVQAERGPVSLPQQSVDNKAAVA
ncbi:MAG: cobalamin-dependent protein [Nitrospirales bacterium]|nr:cobalamin-dependent protein [Nitrospira sp.]MDR4502359.1 cobalamin-dependent protein [Nitrospirales bacterium]